MPSTTVIVPAKHLDCILQPGEWWADYQWLRLDFTDGIAPPTSRKLLEQAPTLDGTPGAAVVINNGVPVALGTPLSTQAVPEPSTLSLMALSLAGLVGWHMLHVSRLR